MRTPWWRKLASVLGLLPSSRQPIVRNRLRIELLEDRLAPAAVTVFDNGAFVDTGGAFFSESDNVQASLASLGHTVSTFTGTSAGAITAALAGQDAVLIPEQEIDPLISALDSAARTAFSDFVSSGGGLIIHGSFAGETESFLNGVFGFALSHGNNSPGGPYAIAANATGTAFSGGAASLPDNNGTYLTALTSLPLSAKSIYDDGTDTAVAILPFGAGEIVFLAWDWFDASPVGSQNGGWVTALEQAVQETGPIRVNSLADNTTAGDGLVTLREAIAAANQDTSTDLGNRGSGADRIVFIGAAVGGSFVLNSQLPNITSEITILGTTATKETIDGDNAARIFHVLAGGSLTLSDMTLQNGNAGAGDGGAILINADASLNLQSIRLTNNNATNGGAIAQTGGTVNVDPTIIENNTATGDGGGVYITSGTFNLTDSSEVRNNSAGDDGGGFYIDGGTTFVNINTDAEVTGNKAADDGGGIYITNGSTLVIDDARIGKAGASNVADNGDLTDADDAGNGGDGGGIFVTGGSVNIQNGATVQSNSADSGGGIDIDAPQVVLTNISDGFSNTDFEIGTSATFGPISANQLSFSTSGFAHSHGGLVSIFVEVHDPNSDVWTTVFQQDLDNSNILFFDGLVVNFTSQTVDQVRLNSSPAQFNTYHNWGVLALTVSGSASVTLDSATVGGASAALGNSAAIDGGGINLGNGSLAFVGGASTVQFNTAERDGGGINATSSFAGALALTNLASIIDNSASRHGGGVNLAGGTSAVWTTPTLQRNHADSGRGGAIHVAGTFPGAATLTLNGTVIGGSLANANTADEGGGIAFESSGTLKLTAATISFNSADLDGGGVFQSAGFVDVDPSSINNNSADDDGGGAAVVGGTFELRDGSTVHTNSAGDDGGGLFVDGGLTQVFINTDSEVTGNTAVDDGGGLFVNDALLVQIDDARIGKAGAGNVADSGDADDSDDAGNGGDGGGIFVAAGSISIQNGTTIRSNSADNGGGINYAGGTNPSITGSTIASNGAALLGGGINVTGAFTSTLTINQSTIGGALPADGNTATDGGGIAQAAGTISVDPTIIENNTASADGGGVYLTGGDFYLTVSSLVRNNTAANDGGGFYIDGAGSSVRINSDSEVTGNKAGDDGGGIFINNALLVEIDDARIGTAGAGNIADNGDLTDADDAGNGGDGGGIFVASGSLVLQNGTTIRNNSADNGGGINYSGGANPSIVDATIAGNSAALQGGGINVAGLSQVVLSSLAGGSSFDSTTSDIFGPICADRLSFSTPGYAHSHGGLVSVFVEVHDPSTGLWTTVFQTNLNNSDQFFFDGLEVSFSHQLVDQVRLNSNPAQGQTYHNWDSLALTVASGGQPVSLTVSGSTIGGTLASDANTATDGGGFYISGSTSTVQINTSTEVIGNRAADDGGGIFVCDALLVQIDDAHIGIAGAGNVADDGDATDADDAGNGGDGGGIFVAAGSVTIQNGTTIRSNSADNGGGINYAGGTTPSITSSTIASNSAVLRGGGINVTSTFASTLTISESTIGGALPADGNTATDGGGIAQGAGTVSVDPTIIENNTVTGDGGGVNVIGGTFNLTDSSEVRNNAAGDDGGGFYIDGATTLVNINTDSEVTGNTAADDGGGIFVNNVSALVIDDARIGKAGAGNTANSDSANGGDGGGMSVAAGNVTIQNGTTIQSNSAENGGGIKVDGNTAVFTELTGDISDADFNSATTAVFGSFRASRLSFATTGFAHSHGGLVNVFVEVHNPDTNLWTTVFQQNIDNGDEFAFDGLIVSFTPQPVDQVRLNSNPGQNQTYHGWDDLFLTVSDGVMIDDSTIGGASAALGNIATFNGGGINAVGGGVILQNDTKVQRNSAGVEGGGINVTGSADVAFLEVLPFETPFYNGIPAGIVSENSAARGGGLNVSGGQLAMDVTTVSANSATSTTGGGLNVSGGNVLVRNSTISENSAPTLGGGLNFSGGTASLTNVTVSNNTTGGGMMVSGTADVTLLNDTFWNNTGDGVQRTGGTVTTTNTIFAGNSGMDFNGLITTSNGYNLLQSSIGATGTVPGIDVLDRPARLADLASYGGPTQTNALLPGSFALDTGSDDDAPERDQRGLARIVNDHADIGAYESRGFTLTRIPDNETPPGDTKYRGLVGKDFLQDDGVTAIIFKVSVVANDPALTNLERGVISFVSTTGTAGDFALPHMPTTTFVSNVGPYSAQSTVRAGQIASESGALAYYLIATANPSPRPNDPTDEGPDANNTDWILFNQQATTLEFDKQPQNTSENAKAGSPTPASPIQFRPSGGAPTSFSVTMLDQEGVRVRVADLSIAIQSYLGTGRIFQPAAVNTIADTITLFGHGFQTGQALVYDNALGASITGASNTVFHFNPAAVDIGTNTITFSSAHGLTTGQALTYQNGGGTNIGGLVNSLTYYAIFASGTSLKLAYNPAEAAAGTEIDLTSTGSASQSLTPTYYAYVVDPNTIQLAINQTKALSALAADKMQLVSQGGADQSLAPTGKINSTLAGSLTAVNLASGAINSGDTIAPTLSGAQSGIAEFTNADLRIYSSYPTPYRLQAVFTNPNGQSVAIDQSSTNPHFVLPASLVTIASNFAGAGERLFDITIVESERGQVRFVNSNQGQNNLKTNEVSLEAFDVSFLDGSLIRSVYYDGTEADVVLISSVELAFGPQFQAQPILLDPINSIFKYKVFLTNGFVLDQMTPKNALGKFTLEWFITRPEASFGVGDIILRREGEGATDTFERFNLGRQRGR